jgi:hypothetical protein
VKRPGSRAPRFLRYGRLLRSPNWIVKAGAGAPVQPDAVATTKIALISATT